MTRPSLHDSYESDIPARLDRLPWTSFHWLIVTALGATWVLDGLEVTIVGSLSGVLAQRGGLGLSSAQIGAAGSAYVTGAVLGALVFGDLADRFGRKRLFFATLGIYMVATVASGCAWNFWSFALFRMVTGAGIGGEYAAINSAIQEFVPAEYRGRTDLFVNGSYWLGAAIGAMGALVILDPDLVPYAWAWRLAFICGGLLAAVILLLRGAVPESPRWLLTHGRHAQARRVVESIERRVSRPVSSARMSGLPKLRLRIRAGDGFGEVARVLLVQYPLRTLLGITLMATQAFCYNAIFFTYALVLTTFYHVAPAAIGWFLLPFAVGNLLGPLLLGRLFDTIGRRSMIAATYGITGLIMAMTGFLFASGMLGAGAQTALWTIDFFFASAGASAAYLTVGESFPLEVRARAISLFFAVGTGLGGIVGPALFGALIGTGTRGDILWGYLSGAVLMVAGAAVEWMIGIDAERRPLEEVAAPLSKM